MEKKKFWFKAKTYGWGWAPASWEGWVVIGIYAVFVTAATSWVTKQAGAGLLQQSAILSFIGIIILVTGALIFLCYMKGEQPRWRWGKSRDEKNQSF